MVQHRYIEQCWTEFKENFSPVLVCLCVCECLDIRRGTLEKGQGDGRRNSGFRRPNLPWYSTIDHRRTKGLGTKGDKDCVSRELDGYPDRTRTRPTTPSTVERSRESEEGVQERDDDQDTVNGSRIGRTGGREPSSSTLSSG